VLVYKRKELLIMLLLAFLYYSTALLSSFIFANTSIISAGIFIPEGIALAFALYFGPKVVPGIFIGQFIFAILNTHFFFFSLIVAIVNSLEALIAISLFSKFKLDKRLTNFRDLIGLFLLSIFILEPFSAIVSNSMFLFYKDNFLSNTFAWWFGNIMAQMLYTPFLLLFLNNYKKIDIKEYLLYAAFYGSIVFIFLFVIVINNYFLLISITLPLLIYIVYKKGIVYGSVLNVVLSLVTALTFVFNSGIFQTASTLDNTINYNLFILMHVLISLTIGILFEQRKRHEEELQTLIDEEVQKNKEQQLLMIQQSRLAQMGEMISMIAHQWRQPLNNLSLINQLLLSKYNKEQLDEKTMEYFKKNSQKQIALMSSTIDDFRNFFKTENEKKESNIETVLSNLAEISQPIYKNHNINLVINIEKCFVVSVYPNALSQAILNIINNAKDALVDRNVDDKKITITVEEEEKDIIIMIEDNAGGIASDIIDKIFDPYFSTKNEKNGTGLGLYMTKMIIEEQLEAKIRVKNTQEGAKFTIYLKGKRCEQ